MCPVYRKNKKKLISDSLMVINDNDDDDDVDDNDSDFC